MSATVSVSRTQHKVSLKAKLTIALTAVVAAAVALLLSALRTSKTTDINPVSGLPTPPRDLPYLTGNNFIAIVALGIVGLSGVVLGVVKFVRTRNLLPLMIALSGAAICVPEVFYDIVGAVYFPWSPTATGGEAFTILGRTMPWWIIAGWFGYGVFNYFTFKLLEANPRTKVLWWMLGGAAVGDVVFEELLLKLDVYHYYGNQPLILVSELPWWWIPCNSIGVFLAAAIAYRYRAQMRGWKALLMAVVTPMSVTAVYGFIALPSWIAVNGNYPWLITQLLGLITIALGLAAFALILDLVLKRNPFDLEYAPPERTEAETSAPEPESAPSTPASVS